MEGLAGACDRNTLRTVSLRAFGHGHDRHENGTGFGDQELVEGIGESDAEMVLK